MRRFDLLLCPAGAHSQGFAPETRRRLPNPIVHINALDRHATMGFGSKGKGKQPEDVAYVPPLLSDLHCFTETEGVITTSWPGQT